MATKYQFSSTSSIMYDDCVCGRNLRIRWFADHQSIGDKTKTKKCYHCRRDSKIARHEKALAKLNQAIAKARSDDRRDDARARSVQIAHSDSDSDSDDVEIVAPTVPPNNRVIRNYASHSSNKRRRLVRRSETVSSDEEAEEAEEAEESSSESSDETASD